MLFGKFLVLRAKGWAKERLPPEISKKTFIVKYI